MYYAVAHETLEALATHLAGFTRRVAAKRRRARRCQDQG
jgi:hypothetical protein